MISYLELGIFIRISVVEKIARFVFMIKYLSIYLIVVCASSPSRSKAIL